MANTTYLITGGNRGIGSGLVAFFLARPSSTVIVSVRNPQASSAALQKLPVGKDSSLIIIPIDFAVNESVASGISELKSKHGITTIDIVIANAALGSTFPKVLDAKLEDYLPHYQVNVVGQVALFQAVYPLLEKAKEPKLITIGSGAGQLVNTNPFPNAVYAPTKAALHLITKQIHQEHENIIAFVIDPGWVKTAMGNAGAHAMGIESAEIETDTSVNGLTKVVDISTRDSHSGRFWHYTGKELQW